MEIMTGGWEFNQTLPTVNLPAELESIFRSAAAKNLGGTFEPLGFLCSQVVNGFNYKFLAYVAPHVSGGATGKAKIAIVQIYVDLEGNAKITKVIDI